MARTKPKNKKAKAKPKSNIVNMQEFKEQKKRKSAAKAILKQAKNLGW